MEGNLRFKIDWASLIVAYSWKEIDRFCFILVCIWGQFPSTIPRGAYFRRGDLTKGFLRYEFGGPFIWRGLFSEFYGSANAFMH